MSISQIESYKLIPDLVKRPPEQVYRILGGQYEPVECQTSWSRDQIMWPRANGPGYLMRTKWIRKSLILLALRKFAELNILPELKGSCTFLFLVQLYRKCLEDVKIY